MSPVIWVSKFHLHIHLHDRTLWKADRLVAMHLTKQGCSSTQTRRHTHSSWKRFESTTPFSKR